MGVPEVPGRRACCGTVVEWQYRCRAAKAQLRRSLSSVRITRPLLS